MLAVADVMMSPQRAVRQIESGAAMLCAKRAALGVLAYLVQSDCYGQ